MTKYQKLVDKERAGVCRLSRSTHHYMDLNGQEDILLMSVHCSHRHSSSPAPGQPHADTADACHSMARRICIYLQGQTAAWPQAQAWHAFLC